MKLSEEEKRVLTAVELHADLSVEDISESSGIKKNSVRYSIHKFQQNGLIRKVPFVNMYPLGFTDFVVFFSITSKNSKSIVQSGLKKLYNSEYVTWIGELGGQYQYGMAIFVKDVAEFVQFLDTLQTYFEGATIRKSVRISKQFKRYNRTFFAPDMPKEVYSFGTTTTPVHIDAIDEKILLTMTKFPELSAHRQAIRANIADATWRYRIQRLKECGVYLGDMYVIDTTMLGYTFYNIHVFTTGIRSAFEEDVRTWASTHPHVVQFIECIAPWDFEIGIDVCIPQQISAIIQEIYHVFGEHIVDIQTIPIFAHTKYTFFRPVCSKA